MRYRAKGMASLVFWDKECVIYHHQSGNTHLVNEVPEKLLLRSLAEQPYSQEELLVILQHSADFSGQDCSGYINQLLAMLEKKELIEQLN